MIFPALRGSSNFLRVFANSSRASHALWCVLQSTSGKRRKHRMGAEDQQPAQCVGVRLVTSDGYCEEKEPVQLKERDMRTDAEIRRDVESELQWDPSIEHST